MRRVIRENMRDFLAIIALGLIGIAATATILVQQQARLPGWVPLVGSDRFELRGEFTSAQAVTPGQGQSVNIAGIRVGDITGVELEGGTAVVTMAVEEEYASLIHPDATLLLRPRTGLQDMTVEVQPGTAEGQLEEGSTVPAASTQANVQPDEILASLDADTRAYLQLLLAGGAEALGKHDRALSADLRRLEPTARDLARIGGALAERRQSLRRVITSFRALSEELGREDTRLAEFVSSSESVLHSFAREEDSIRAAVRELPGALHETRRALEGGDRLAQVLGPAARDLQPAARELAPALRATQPFFRETTEPIAGQIRPFTRDVQDPVRHLAQGAPPLGKTTLDLGKALGDLNLLLNGLAYNPPGTEEGYLFWLAWLNHATNAIFLTQDANGPLRRGIVIQSCQTAQLAEGVAQAYPILKTLQQITNVATHAEIEANGGC